MQCANGHEAAPGSKFCSLCGLPLVEDESSGPERNPPIPATTESVDLLREGVSGGQEFVRGPSSQPPPAQSATRSDRHWVRAVVAVTVLGVVAFALVQHDRAKSTTTPPRDTTPSQTLQFAATGFLDIAARTTTGDKATINFELGDPVPATSIGPDGTSCGADDRSLAVPMTIQVTLTSTLATEGVLRFLPYLHGLGAAGLLALTPTGTFVCKVGTMDALGDTASNDDWAWGPLYLAPNQPQTFQAWIILSSVTTAIGPAQPSGDPRSMGHFILTPDLAFGSGTVSSSASGSHEIDCNGDLGVPVHDLWIAGTPSCF